MYIQKMKKDFVSKKIKIGFLIDSQICAHNVYNLIENVSNNSDIFETIVIIDNTHKEKKKLKTKNKISKQNRNYLSYIVEFLIVKLETKILDNSDLRGSNKYKDINLLSLKKYIINCKISKSHLYKDFDKNIKEITSLNLDLIIRCGSGILKGKILSSSRFGILSSHHGDNRVMRGGPSGFWEVYKKYKTTGFVIQRINEKLDGGDILIRGNSSTENLWIINKKLQQKQCNIAWLELLKDINKKQKLPDFEPPFDYFGNINQFPKWWILVNYFLRFTLIEFIKYKVKNFLH